MKKVSLELGGGGRLMRDFIAERVLPAFGNPILGELSDSGLLPDGLAFTTDSYVVDPLFFPGGDIGTLAVNGTVNDLVVSGAEPRFLSFALILEEGLEWEVLDRVLRSVRKATKAAKVRIVTGDTKVVRQGQGDKVFVNTAGIGRSVARPRVDRIRPGDEIILTGAVGDHTLAVMLARGEFGLSTKVRSDCAPLLFLLPLWKRGALWMRDVTRGGLATVLFELAERLPYPVLVEEDKVPLSRAVRGASDLLGIDPLYMACEGKAVIVAPKGRTADFLRRVRGHPLGRKAEVIGRVQKKIGRPGELLLQTAAGGLRLLEPLTSELLPRIC
ncbi:MAG: hydrogenase expression/formation protein HypE [Candidatus Aminicenantes bacterium]|nr:hydrogenase expression/formation protein HypE [Candidatus Aminicenantes bacterium]